ncbi:unnamed protein product [Prorocentrum cordatum]|uniref:EF-hand domain-containing protein n=1 Tax=Prorocentrum cordatum TaxID=2364126 RepID=A0ABN9RQS4_9DINO|nr:unnamed protein product [Polarella glacialis]|mmetsp:Transcript_35000/g.100144  ORF Transcript_35000/g.100144 Transcript_35000/m.100144 type:complete len:263 (-) Transcript_35000:157-945(-)
MAGHARGGRGGKGSFERLFQRDDAAVDTDRPPSVHELFTASMRDEITLQQFREALVDIHGLDITSAADKLISSVDAASGRLSFADFQRAMSQVDSSASGGAGKPVHYKDQAKSIISDNSGAAAPAPLAMPKKQHSDISNDAFVIRKTEVDKRSAAKGEWGANPVLRTNQVSAGNPLAERVGAVLPGEDSSEPRDMANTATRMFVSGELDAASYEQFLQGLGVGLSDESEIRRLITAHKKTGDGSFTRLSRAVQAELARAGEG